MDSILSQLPKDPGSFLLITAWTLAWKGIALWQAAKSNQRNWFITLLVINSLGLLEIIFLIWFVKKDRFWDKIIKKAPPKPKLLAKKGKN